MARSHWVRISIACGAALLLSACGSGSSGGGGSSTGSGSSGGGTAASGASLFKQTCAGCHTLAAAGANGTMGPNLDELHPTKETVLAQIQRGGGGMPSGLLKGADADAVAAYVSKNAG